MSAPENTSPTLCLIDGSGYIFRAFYALPPMKRADGTPVNAVYGFITMLMNLIQENRCSHMVVVFDAKRRNFRNDIYPAYKENRRETPPELIPQFPLIRQAVQAFSVPFIEQEGFEADDLIATYARLATEQGFHAQVISADKDLMQLIRDGVSLYDPMKKKEITPDDVLAKFGVLPDKVTDVQALMGDSTDNVPGASGIGPKTAAQLINQFGSLDSLFQHITQVTPVSRQEKLAADKELVLISKKLVDLDTAVPVPTDLSVFKTCTIDFDKCQSFLAENSFKSLVAKLPFFAHSLPQTSPITVSADTDTSDTLTPPSHTPAVITHPQPVPASDIPQKYTLIHDIGTLTRVLAEARAKGRLALDTETTGLNFETDKLVGFSLCHTPGEAWYVPVGHTVAAGVPDLFGPSGIALYPDQIPLSQAVGALAEILADETVLKIGHNIKFDMHVLSKARTGLTFAGLEDTMLISYILDGTTHSHKLDDLASLFLNYKTLTFKELCGSGRTQVSVNTLSPDKVCFYACEDADITLRLYDVLKPRLGQDDTDRSDFVYTEIDRPLIPVLYEMEKNGILVNRQHLTHIQNNLAIQLNTLTKEIYALAGEEFNINSPAQLGVVLFEHLNLPTGKKGTAGNWATDAATLETLATEHNSPLAEKIIAYRMYAKLKSTYADALLNLTRTESRIHTWFSQTTTNTGRLSSADPNLQNIPIRTPEGRQIRQAFIAGVGKRLVSADYSQIELRLMACVADVPALKQSFLNNEDIHARTASEIFGVPLDAVDADLRRRAKTINFGIIYGISPFGLAKQLGIERSEAKKYIDAYFAKYPQIQSYIDRTTAFVKEHGYVLTPFGRKCFIQGIHTPALRSFAIRSAINAPIQGGAADIIKMAMLGVAKALAQTDLDAKLLLQVHDELVLEVAPGDIERTQNLLKKVMENTVQLAIPFMVQVGSGFNWKDAH